MKKIAQNETKSKYADKRFTEGLYLYRHGKIIERREMLVDTHFDTT